jgi:hypothetical protein
VAEIGVDCRPQLRLVGLIIELKELALVFSLSVGIIIRKVSFSALRIHHLYLVVQQAHGLDFISKHEPALNLLFLLVLHKLPHEILNSAAVVVQLKDAFIDGFAGLLSSRFFTDGVFLMVAVLVSCNPHPKSDVFFTSHNHSLFFVLCLHVPTVNPRAQWLNLHQTLPQLAAQTQFSGKAVGSAKLSIGEVI